MNLTVQGSIDIIIYSNPNIDINYDVVGDTGLFSPYTFPILNDLLFPIVLKNEDLLTVLTVGAEDPVVSGVTDSHVSGDIYKVQATVTDNRSVWDVVATVEYEDLSTQIYAMNHVSGDLYKFIFTIPNGESASVSIAARDIGGRVDGDVIVVDNPLEVPELGNISAVISVILIPLAIIPVTMKKKKKKKI